MIAARARLQRAIPRAKASRVNGNLEMTGGGRLVCPLAAGD